MLTLAQLRKTLVIMYLSRLINGSPNFSIFFYIEKYGLEKKNVYYTTLIKRIENRDDYKVMIFPGHFSIEKMHTKL